MGGEAEAQPCPEPTVPEPGGSRRSRWSWGRDEEEGGHLHGPPIRLPSLQKPRELDCDDLTSVQSFPGRPKTKQKALECACVDSRRIREPGQGSQAAGVAYNAQTQGPALGPQARFTDHRHSRETPLLNQQLALCARCFASWVTFPTFSQAWKQRSFPFLD